jgi:energy-coupling factor transport system substrate-specific component
LLYAVFSWVTDFLRLPSAGYISLRPATVVPVLAGVMGGPLVGFGAGFLGNIVGDALTLETAQFWWNWHVGNGLVGLSAGLFWLLGWRYRNGRDLLKLLGGVALAELIGLGLAAVAELTLPALQAAIATDAGLASSAQVTARLIVEERYLPAVISNIAMQVLLLPPVLHVLRSQVEEKKRL